ncbi:hypothetical protein IG631_24085 [Alternaria alternata]|nr:hypothetical protein IG631_24085 [Alternaria alternata]
MPNANGLPVADPSWSGAKMLAEAGVNYAMPAHDPSCCGYPCTSSKTAALPRTRLEHACATVSPCMELPVDPGMLSS